MKAAGIERADSEMSEVVTATGATAKVPAARWATTVGAVTVIGAGAATRGVEATAVGTVATEEAEMATGDEKGTEVDGVTDAVDRLMTVAGQAIDECITAMARFAPFNSAHEGYAVILEELDEAWDEIKANNVDATRKEMVQVAAMALRFLVDIEAPEAAPTETESDR